MQPNTPGDRATQFALAKVITAKTHAGYEMGRSAISGRLSVYGQWNLPAIGDCRYYRRRQPEKPPSFAIQLSDAAGNNLQYNFAAT